MAFKDYTEFNEPLALPYRGKVYEIPPVSARDGATLLQALDPDSDVVLTRDDERRILLGGVLEQMEADGVPAAFVARCVVTALTDFQAGREVAEIVWEHGADPKAIEAWLTAKTPEASTPSNRTGEDDGTPSPASTTGTTSTKRRPTTKR